MFIGFSLFIVNMTFLAVGTEKYTFLFLLLVPIKPNLYVQDLLYFGGLQKKLVPYFRNDTVQRISVRKWAAWHIFLKKIDAIWLYYLVTTAQRHYDKVQSTKIFYILQYG